MGTCGWRSIRRSGGLLEKMENESRALFREVSPSVVIVERAGCIDYFCVGSVILSEGESTFILSPRSLPHLRNCPSGSRMALNSLLLSWLKLEEEKLCILVTKFYPKCKAVQFSEGDIDHTYAGAIAPANRSSVYTLPGFIIQRPCEAGCYSDLIEGSRDDFTFVCQYGDRSANRVSRLLSGPVFNLKGHVLGVVLDDMEYYKWPQREDGTIFHKEVYCQLGFSLKVGMTVSRLQALLRNLDGDWRRGLKQMAAKSLPLPKLTYFYVHMLMR